jgi:hypothetical protein
VRFLLVLLLLPFAGCATIVRGTEQEIRVDCDVKEATITLDGVPVAAGPILVKRGDSHVLRATAEGYEPATVALDPHVSGGWAFAETVLGVAGFAAYGLGELVTFVPLLVDSLDGAIESFDEEEVHLHLKRIEEWPRPVAVTSEDGERFCPGCGTAYEQEARFCTACGRARKRY